MICPSCDSDAEFTPRQEPYREPHGETGVDFWLVCNSCNAATDWAELDKVNMAEVTK